MNAPTVSSLLQGFFTERLVRQLQASPQTISAYRDTIRLLLLYAAKKTGKSPSRLEIDDLDAVTVGKFLTHLDTERHNSTATRNARLAAIHSFYRYALPLIPERAHTQPGPGHPPTPSRTRHRLLSDRPRDRGPAGGTRSDHLVRASRPRPAHHRRTNWVAPL